MDVSGVDRLLALAGEIDSTGVRSRGTARRGVTAATAAGDVRMPARTESDGLRLSLSARARDVAANPDAAFPLAPSNERPAPTDTTRTEAASFVETALAQRPGTRRAFAAYGRVAASPAGARFDVRA